MDYGKVVLFSDLDGTLFNNQTQVPEINREAIERFCRAGGIFCISSGRIPSNIAGYIEGIPVNGPCILYNGSAVYDWSSGTYLYKRMLETEAAEDFLRMVQKSFPQVDIQVYPGDEICFVSPKETADEEFVRLHQPCRFQTLETVEKPWFKILIMGEPELLRRIREKGEALPDVGDFIFTRADYLEILPRGVSKGSALSQAMGCPELAGRFSAAIGDFYNDIELLKAADLGIAPSNALDEVKQAADRIGCSNEEGVVADCIDRIIPEW